MVSILQAAKNNVGIYTAKDAAIYAGVPERTLSRWFFGYSKFEPLRSPQIEGNEKQIGFLDLIEAKAVRFYRTTYGVSFQKIREAINTAQKEYGLEHPFAQREHRTYLVGKDFFIIPNGEYDPVGLTGKDRNQTNFKVCIEPYMEDLEFNHEGIAKLLIAKTYKSERILLDPNVNFGAPHVENYGYSAETLWRAAISEGSYKRAAELYEVSVDAVAASFRYCSEDIKLAA